MADGQEDPVDGPAGDPPEPQSPVVGDRHEPYNDGRIGATYTIWRCYHPDGRLLRIGTVAGPGPENEAWWRDVARIELQHLPPGTTHLEALAEEHRQIDRLGPAYQAPGPDRDHAGLLEAGSAARFEQDVAADEHTRHDGVVRPIDDVAADSRRTAERLRPDGGAVLRTSPPAPDAPVGPTHLLAEDAEAVRRRDAAWDNRYLRAIRRPVGPHNPSGDEDFYPVLPRNREGPGSTVGLAIVTAVLVVLVVIALVVSIQVVL